MSNLAIKGLQNLEIKSDVNTEESSLNNFLNIIEQVNKLPFSQGNFYFSDNLWDFSPYKVTNISNTLLRFDFSTCSLTFRNDIKKFVVFKILEQKLKLQSIKSITVKIISFLNDAEKAGYFHINDIDEKFLYAYLEQVKDTQSFHSVQCSLKNFYNYYSHIHPNVLSNEGFLLLTKNNQKFKSALRVASKTPDIPENYYTNFLSAIIQIVDDASCNSTIRATAAFYLILSQTGLRISECLSLETDAMSSISIFNGETAHYLSYKTWKRESGDNTFSIVKTYVNELTKKGYDFLVEHYKGLRASIGTKVLYLGTGNNKSYPLSTSDMQALRIKLYLHLNKYFQTIDVPDGFYKNIENISLKSYLTMMHNKKCAWKTVAMPTNHQFRVHVCTELYNKGVPLKYVEKFMSHLSAEMADYYVRPTKQNPQENMEFTLDTLQKIVTGETKLLGGNGGLQAKINEFIEQNHYNVETDLQAICKKLAENIPIRQKTGGVCIKSSMLRECSKDSKTNEFYCAYGVCPNIFHFYYMADVSYRQAKELSETIKINKDRGLVRQVEKETNMLRHIIKVKLIPELDELKNVVNKKGAQNVLIEYPDLQEIIGNLDNIYKEVSIWQEMK